MRYLVSPLFGFWYSYIGSGWVLLECELRYRLSVMWHWQGMIEISYGTDYYYWILKLKYFNILLHGVTRVLYTQIMATWDIWLYMRVFFFGFLLRCTSVMKLYTGLYNKCSLTCLWPAFYNPLIHVIWFELNALLYYIWFLNYCTEFSDLWLTSLYFHAKYLIVFQI